MENIQKGGERMSVENFLYSISIVINLIVLWLLIKMNRE